MKKLLFFDTETSGLYQWGQDPLYFKQPYCVQLAMLVTDDKFNKLFEEVLLVNNEVDIPEGAAKVHGLSREYLSQHGKDPRYVTNRFFKVLNKCDIAIGHNVKFDVKVMQTMAMRNDVPMCTKPVECTMHMAEPIMKMPDPRNPNRVKRPKLEEAYRHFCGKTLEGAHDAGVDTRACMEIYQRMKLDA